MTDFKYLQDRHYTDVSFREIAYQLKRIADALEAIEANKNNIGDDE